jgi:hypothetical protein
MFLDHTHTHTQQVGLLSTSDQQVAEAATYTTHNIHKRRTSMPSAGLEMAIPAIRQLQTYALGLSTPGSADVILGIHIATIMPDKIFRSI